MKKAGIKYINLVKGQLKGIITMIEDDRYCLDIVDQLSASIALLKKTQNTLLIDHLSTCVAKDLTDEQLEKIEEIKTTLRKLL